MQNPLEEFARKHGLFEDGHVCTIISELSYLKRMGYSPEAFFRYLVRAHNFLLHGSREEINDALRPNDKGELFATDNAEVAIMRAIISNKNSRLQYPYKIDDAHPLVVTIRNRQADTVGERGFVYIIGDRAGFVNHPPGSWQYVSHSDVHFRARVEVFSEDVLCPVKYA